MLNRVDTLTQFGGDGLLGSDEQLDPGNGAMGGTPVTSLTRMERVRRLMAY